jgi:hypothetical protein
LIGYLSDLAAHPLWRLSPPMPDAAPGPSIRVAIGSDDPTTFATSLPEEYQLVAFALADAGVAPAQADAWRNAAGWKAASRFRALACRCICRRAWIRRRRCGLREMDRSPQAASIPTATPLSTAFPDSGSRSRSSSTAFRFAPGRSAAAANFAPGSSERRACGTQALGPVMHADAPSRRPRAAASGG